MYTHSRKVVIHNENKHNGRQTAILQYHHALPRPSNWVSTTFYSPFLIVQPLKSLLFHTILFWQMFLIGAKHPHYRRYAPQSFP